MNDQERSEGRTWHENTANLTTLSGSDNEQSIWQKIKGWDESQPDIISNIKYIWVIYTRIICTEAAHINALFQNNKNLPTAKGHHMRYGSISPSNVYKGDSSSIKHSSSIVFLRETFSKMIISPFLMQLLNVGIHYFTQRIQSSSSQSMVINQLMPWLWEKTVEFQQILYRSFAASWD